MRLDIHILSDRAQDEVAFRAIAIIEERLPNVALNAFIESDEV